MYYIKLNSSSIFTTRTAEKLLSPYYCWLKEYSRFLRYKKQRRISSTIRGGKAFSSQMVKLNSCFLWLTRCFLHYKRSRGAPSSSWATPRQPRVVLVCQHQQWPWLLLLQEEDDQICMLKHICKYQSSCKKGKLVLPVPQIYSIQ